MYLKAVTQMAERTFAQWLSEEIEGRRMSIRAFAAEVGVGHTTLNRILNPQKEEDMYPSVDTLIKLARYTKVDACILLGFLAPEDTRLDADVFLMAQRILNLPPDAQEVVDTWLMGRNLKPGDQKS